MERLRLGAVLLALIGAAPAAGQTISVPKLGGFHSVLAGGEGQTVNAADLAAYEGSNEPPARFVDQQPLYVGIMPKASSLTAADIDTYYKPTEFGAMPGGVDSTVHPRAGVTIIRDKRFGMAHIYGDTRADVMFGAGYATATERLFLMDALRNTAEGSLASLTGASAAKGDAAQLTDQDFSPAELQAQFDDLPNRLGADGARAHPDTRPGPAGPPPPRKILDSVDAINASIDEASLDPTKIPAEYAALGTRPRA